MISHGVDADRFNLMLFYGMPGNTAEYIQAYSRVGRKHTGVVIDIMRPSREKDQSYLKNFNKFHEYKDIMVEAVPINRWATKAIKCTLPGMFTGLLLNLYDIDYEYRGGSLFSMKNIKRAIAENYLDAQIIKSQLKEAYGCTDGQFEDDLGNQYAEEIDRFIDCIFAEISDQAWTDENIFTGFSRLGYRIMNSLRDTDAQLIVELE
jgi:superfamily II DNA/RNA helicase